MAENDIASEKKHTAFDEQTLAKMLEAAYVLQEHNRQQQRSQKHDAGSAGSPDTTAIPNRPIDAVKAQPQNPPAKPARQDFPRVLARIVETQQQIQAENLDLPRAMDLIANRAMQVAQAGGAGIGILENGKVRYLASAGSMALAVASDVKMENALCSASLRVGQVIRCGSVNLEFLVDAEECARRGIESLIAAPIHNGGSVAGALELYYDRPQSFTEPDVHACQLMAGLAGEVLARSEGLASKQSLQAERAAMRNALEKLKPNLEALVEPVLPAQTVPPLSFPASLAAERAPGAACCTKCGNELLGDEQFCGKCGMARKAKSETLSMQSKVAMLWQMHEQQNKSAVRNPANGSSAFHAPAGALEAFSAEDLCESTMPELGELLAPDGAPHFLSEFPAHNDTGDSPPSLIDGNLALDEDAQANRTEDGLPPASSADTALVAVPRSNWTSAAAAREFLERVARENRDRPVVRFLNARRGDVYLVLAIILVAFVIRWGVWSDKPATSATSTTVSHHTVYNDLSLFDRMLIKLGLADPPDPPVYKGNPNTKVWIDEQTALYYCPGSDLYGKTPKGRMTTQQDAQLDQFEPASRKACN